MAQLQLIEMGLLCEAGALEAEIKAEITADKSSNNGADSEAAVGSDGILRKIQNYIAKCEEREEEEACPQSGGTRRRAPRAKNLMEFRSNVMSEFVKVCSHGVKKCLYCTAPVRSLRQENRTKVFLKPLSAKHAQSWIEAEKGLAKVGLLRSAMDENTGKDEVVSEVQYSSPESLRKQRYLTPLEVREHVQSLWNGQKALVNAIVGCTVMVEEEEEEGRDEGAVAGVVRRRVHEISPADVFFLDVIPVPPSRFRPVSEGWEGVSPPPVSEGWEGVSPPPVSEGWEGVSPPPVSEGGRVCLLRWEGVSPPPVSEGWEGVSPPPVSEGWEGVSPPPVSEGWVEGVSPPPVSEGWEGVSPPPVSEGWEGVSPPPVSEGWEGVSPPPVSEGWEGVSPPPVSEGWEGVSPPPVSEGWEGVSPPPVSE